LDEVAGATDAIACSGDGYFLSYKIRALSDNSLAVLHAMFVDDLASGTPGRSNGETAIENP
jgi:hypothetical protein